MTTARETVLAALKAVLSNSWLVELPPVPVWPAVVFSIETEPEPGWCQGGEYEHHTVKVVGLGRDADYLDQALMPAIAAVMEAIQPAYLTDEGAGDAEYEPDPEVYGRYQVHVLRMRKPS